MVVSKKYTKKLFKRSKRNVRRSRITRFKNVANQVHYFKRTFEYGNVSSHNVDVHVAWSVSLGQLPNSSEFTNLYDKYKIISAKFQVVPIFNVNSMQTNEQLVPVLYVHDYDDSGPLSSDAEYYQFSNFKQRRAGTVFNIMLYPKVATTVYNTALTSGYATQRPMWLDCDSPNVPHYGLKIKFPTCFGSGDNSVTYRVLATVTFACMNAR